MARPHQLDQGIFLEDRGILLPWLASPETLTTIASPEQHREGTDQIQLLWRHTIVLGGLPCTLSTRLRTIERPLTHNKKIPWYDSGRLLLMDFTRLPLDDFSDARLEFESIREHLLPTFGTPTNSLTGENGRPAVVWRYPEFSVNLAVEDRFTEYCVLQVRYFGKR